MIVEIKMTCKGSGGSWYRIVTDQGDEWSASIPDGWEVAGVVMPIEHWRLNG